MPCSVRADDVALEVVADHPRQLRRRRRAPRARRRSTAALGLPSTVASMSGGVLEPGDERARVEARPVGGLPPAVPVQAVELGAGLELEERAVQVQVREDAARSPRPRRRRRSARRRRSCRRAAGPRGRRGCRASSARARACPSSTRAATLPVVCSSSSSSVDPHRAQLLAELRARARRRVRDEANPVARARAGGAPRRPLRRSARRRRAARRPRRGESPPWTPSLFGRKSPSGSPARAGRAASTRRRARPASRRCSTSRARRR